MVRGQDETSTNQAGRMRGPSQELPSATSLVSSKSMEELKSYCQILDSISLELSDGPAASTVGEVDSAVYFTREQFAARLRFPISSLVKQFLHVSRAPPKLIHLNAIQILMGYSVLNLLYLLDISLGFAARMRKRFVTLEGEATSSLEEKRPGRSPSDEGA